jgi:hypothetical protein
MIQANRSSFLKERLKKMIGWDTLSPAKKFVVRYRLNILANLVFKFLPLNLTFLAQFYGSDKWGRHSYTNVYEKLFYSLRYKNINLMEIGVGGYDDPYSGGSSVFMWKSYFLFAQLFFIDIADKSRFSGGRAKVFQGSQGDSAFLRQVANEVGQFDIIIDDGSHVNEHQIETFKTLFPFLKSGGVYIIEDTQTSYWPKFGGGNLGTKEYEQSCMQFFLRLVDGLNYGEFLDEKFSPSEFSKKIVEISFCHNLIIVRKGNNGQVSVLENSNALKLKQPMETSN